MVLLVTDYRAVRTAGVDRSSFRYLPYTDGQHPSRQNGKFDKYIFSKDMLCFDVFFLFVLWMTQPLMKPFHEIHAPSLGCSVACRRSCRWYLPEAA